MIYLLDTDMASYVIKGASQTLDVKLSRQRPGSVFISSVTRAELRFGVRRLANAHKLASEVARFLAAVPTLPWDERAADAFADMRAILERAGTPIGVMDTMIASHALATGAVLVSNNLRHFRRVKNLAIENWTAP